MGRDVQLHMFHENNLKHLETRGLKADEKVTLRLPGRLAMLVDGYQKSLVPRSWDVTRVQDALKQVSKVTVDMMWQMYQELGSKIINSWCLACAKF
eukprot:4281732-Amphidinium_carterae.3